MARPIPSVTKALLAKKTQEFQLLESPSRNEEYAEKLKLASDLHAQGIDPTRWTAAQPADWTTQQAFQKTGQKDDRHFVVGNRLYKTAPHVAANEGATESREVQALRLKLAAENATAQADAGAMVANDNDPDIDEVVARSYLAESQPPTSKFHNLFLTDYRKYLSTISKLRQGLTLN